MERTKETKKHNTKRDKTGRKKNGRGKRHANQYNTIAQLRGGKEETRRIKAPLKDAEREYEQGQHKKKREEW